MSNIEQLKRLVEAHAAYIERPKDDDDSARVNLNYHHALAMTSFPAILAEWDADKQELDDIRRELNGEQRAIIFDRSGMITKIREQQARIAKLEKVVARLPKTKDGVIVTDPRELFWWDGKVLLRGAGCMNEELAFLDPNDPSIEFRPNCGVAGCYSTREAALAAQEANQ